MSEEQKKHWADSFNMNEKEAEELKNDLVYTALQLEENISQAESILSLMTQESLDIYKAIDALDNIIEYSTKI